MRGDSLWTSLKSELDPGENGTGTPPTGTSLTNTLIAWHTRDDNNYTDSYARGGIDICTIKGSGNKVTQDP